MQYLDTVYIAAAWSLTKKHNDLWKLQFSIIQTKIHNHNHSLCTPNMYMSIPSQFLQLVQLVQQSLTQFSNNYMIFLLNS